MGFASVFILCALFCVFCYALSCVLYPLGFILCALVVDLRSCGVARMFWSDFGVDYHSDDENSLSRARPA